MSNTGIYRITVVPSGKQYVGQGVDIYQRWRQHRHLLANNEHFNRHLQASWNKYGEEAFRFEIIELCTESELDAKEIAHIAARPPDCCISQNPGGEATTRGSKRDIDQRRTMSKARGGRPFFAQDEATGFMRRFMTQIEAEEAGFQQSHVWSCLHGLRQTHKGHRFWFDPSVSASPTVPEETRFQEKRNREIIGTCIATGTEKHYACVSDVQADGFTRPSVSKCLGGILETTKGWRWRYADGQPHKTMSEEARQKLRKPRTLGHRPSVQVSITDTRTGTRTLVESIGAAARFLGEEPMRLRYAIKKGHLVQQFFRVEVTWICFEKLFELFGETPQNPSISVYWMSQTFRS